ncbi:serine hydrolase [Candidatus Daviesbacteria bacterium]|nr:serine hydrolase [Candidatus Daviesbacteria bacterium]
MIYYARRRRSHSYNKLFFLILLAALVTLFILRGPIESRINDAGQPTRPTTQPIETQFAVVDQIKKIINSQSGTYAIYFYDLSTNSSWGINEKTVITAASVAKLPILAALYYQAEKKQADLDDLVTVQSGDLQEGTGMLQSGQIYSVKTLARLMMEKSDNTAGHLLAVYLGVDNVQKLVDEWGLRQTVMADNQTSPYDMAKLLTKIYRAEIAGQALTDEMMGFMDDSDFEDRLPALLPKDVKVYHKIGTEVNSIHDVGIINLAQRPYILGVFTHGISDEAQTVSTIAKISQIVFDYQK